MRMSRRLSAYSKPLGVGLIIFLIYYLSSEPTVSNFNLYSMNPIQKYFRLKNLTKQER